MIKYTLIILGFLAYAFASANIIVVNGLTHEFQVVPGQVYRGTIEVQNASNEAKSVRIYQTDYWFSYSGESKHEEPGRMERSNADWVKVNSSFATLQANETQIINFEITVPANNNLKGTYWSVIMVEGVEPPEVQNEKTGFTINTVVRYAIQIITETGNTDQVNLRFLHLGLISDEGVPVLEVDIENTGEKMLKPVISVELFNDKGESQGVIRIDRRRIYPGTSIKALVRLEGIKPGNYTGVLIADCDDDYVFGTQLNLEL